MPTSPGADKLSILSQTPYSVLRDGVIYSTRRGRFSRGSLVSPQKNGGRRDGCYGNGVTGTLGATKVRGHLRGGAVAMGDGCHGVWDNGRRVCTELKNRFGRYFWRDATRRLRGWSLAAVGVGRGGVVTGMRGGGDFSESCGNPRRKCRALQMRKITVPLLHLYISYHYIIDKMHFIHVCIQ